MNFLMLMLIWFIIFLIIDSIFTYFYEGRDLAEFRKEKKNLKFPEFVRI